MIREGYYRLPLVADLRVTGADAETFLQSQFSQDVRGGVGRSVFGLWLDYRGRILGESTILHVDESTFEVISPYTEGDLIAAHMDAHIIADEVEVERQSQRAAILMFTPLEEIEGIQVAEGAWIEWKGGRLCRLDRKLENGWLWMGAPVAEVDLIAHLDSLGFSLLSEETVELERISACFPKIPEEVGERETPGETGLMYGCSLNKGCYLGQEVVARMERLGRARKMLKSVRVEGSQLAKGDLLYSGEKNIGEIRGSLQLADTWVGLGLMKVADYEEESEDRVTDEMGRKVRFGTR